MKSSDIKVGEAYAHARYNYSWDTASEDSITRVEVIEPIEWTSGPSWDRKKRKGFRVEAQHGDTGQFYRMNVTPRELRATWTDYQERLKRVEEMRQTADEAEFNEWILAYAALAQIERAIRKLDITREPVEFEFWNEREMKAAEIGGWLVTGGKTHVAMDYESHFGRNWLRPRFKISQRDAGLLALHVLLKDA